jgi:hypothetical protein
MADLDEQISSDEMSWSIVGTPVYILQVPSQAHNFAPHITCHDRGVPWVSSIHPGKLLHPYTSKRRSRRHSNKLNQIDSITEVLHISVAWNIRCFGNIANSVAWVRERTIPTEWPPPIGEVSANFSDRWCHVVRVTDTYGSILDF